MSFVLSHYRLEEVIGEGGMGIVHRGVDTRLGRPVAVKILHENFARDAKLRERFSQEARLMALMTHPNIVTLYDYIEENDTLALVMELVDGRGMDRMIGKEVGPIVADRALPLFIQILDAFAFAHSKGIIHRDIKPANILITRDDRVKVTDLGIAKIIGKKGLTKTGTRLGTLWYMSPEQVRGEEATVQSDIYALGITLYEMVAGRVPFDDETSDYEVMDAIVKRSLPDPREYYPDIPEYIVDIVKQAVAKDINDRFKSCEGMKSALMGGETHSPRVVTPPKMTAAPKPGTSQPPSAEHPDAHPAKAGNPFEHLPTYDSNTSMWSPKGRMNRGKYFKVQFFLFLGGVIFYSVLYSGDAALIIIAFLLLLCLIAPLNIFSSIRRLHDLELSGWLVLITLIPWIGWVYLLYLLFARGTKGPNRFGPDPLAKK